MQPQSERLCMRTRETQSAANSGFDSLPSTCCCRQGTKQEVKQVAEHKPPLPGEGGKVDAPKPPQ